MKTKQILLVGAVAGSIAATLFTGCTTATGAGSGAATYKMTTPIAPGVAVPDRVETSIGTLHLTDGVPDVDTAAKI
ncbi:MAG: hypothetical protein MUF81_20345, partial [Verrucomicrobia bacterium]|nr:hypothetical protein [Verrucomicrobiota bacterium]